MKSAERIQNALIGAMIVAVLAPGVLTLTANMLPQLLPLNPLYAAFLVMTCGVLIASLQSAWAWVEEALGHETGILPVLYIVGTAGAVGGGAPFSAREVFMGLMFCIAVGSLLQRYIKFLKQPTTINKHALEKKKNEAQQPPLEIPTRLILEAAVKSINPWNIVDPLTDKEEQETA
jgi:hypothetical protein